MSKRLSQELAKQEALFRRMQSETGESGPARRKQPLVSKGRAYFDSGDHFKALDLHNKQAPRSSHDSSAAN